MVPELEEPEDPEDPEEPMPELELPLDAPLEPDDWSAPRLHPVNPMLNAATTNRTFDVVTRDFIVLFLSLSK